MKLLIASLLLFLSYPSTAQMAEPLSRELVLRAPTKTKGEIFVAAQTFLVSAFRKSKEVIQMKDETSGIIMGKGNFSYEFSTPRFTCNRNNGKGIVRFSIKIMIKENRSKLELTDFVHESLTDVNVNIGLITDKPPVVSFMQKCNTDVYHDIVDQIDDLMARLGREYQKELSSDNDDDW